MTRAMKDSGVEWIGEIPEDWKTIKLKSITKDHYSGGTPTASKEEFYTEDTTKGFPFTNISDITSQRVITLTTKRITDKGVKNKNLKLVPKGSLLYAMYASVGKLSISQIDLYISQAILAFDTTEKADKQYLIYCLNSLEPFVDYFSNGTTQMNLNAEIVKNLKVVTPPSVIQQEAIAYFLDQKTSEIEGIKRDIEKEIEVLEEYKRSIIFEVVTKGLDKDVEMKDSGVEWIGEIPKDWKVHPISRYFIESKNVNKFGKEKNLLSLSYGKIIRKDIESNEGLLPKNYNSYNIVEKGNIIIRSLDLQNDKKSLRTGYVKEKGIITSAYIALKPLDRVFSQYYYYLLHSYDIVKVFYNMGDGVRQSLNYKEFAKLLVLEPPFEDQKKIVEFIIDKEFKINNLIKDKKEQLEVLDEYKKSMIYEYVTGKKEVE